MRHLPEYDVEERATPSLLQDSDVRSQALVTSLPHWGASRVDRCGQKHNTITVPLFLPADGVERIARLRAAEVKSLIAAIDNLKALDPACGSGAFPMGLRHKLVFILGRLEPRNELDCGRKLYLIWDGILKSLRPIRFGGLLRPEWMFGIHAGFHVLLGNPPHLLARESKQKRLTAEDKNCFCRHYVLAEHQFRLGRGSRTG